MLVIGNFSDTRRIKPAEGDSERTEEPNESGGDLHLVQIPQYHTGHLGFVPKKTVLLTGPLPQDDLRGPERRTCEVVVTPHTISREILKVSCTFHEGKHVLERLVELLTHLNVNIIALESASIFESKYHIVHLVLDMSRSILSYKQMSDGERSKFIDILPNLRITNRRGLELFLYIVVWCHEILRWKEGPGSLGRHLPQIFVSEFDEYEWTGEAVRPAIDRKKVTYRGHFATLSTSEEVASKQRSSPRETFFKLPKARGKRVETLLGINAGEQLDYLLLSDTDSRSLRIQFFQSEHRDQIFELGFKHKNEIGALYAILRTVANANFNVLSCLIREVRDYENVWEAVLEYQGPKRTSNGVGKADPRKIMKKLLAKSVGGVAKLKMCMSPYEVGIFIPTHLPEAYKYIQNDIDIGWKYCVELGGTTSGDKPLKPHLEWPDKRGPVEQDWLITYAREMLFKDPKIFISCSSHEDAKKYRVYLKEKLDNRGWEVSIYEDLAKMDLTYGEAKRLIADADYLVGIWLPEETDAGAKPEPAAGPLGATKASKTARPNGKADPSDAEKAALKGTAKLSPWMHFEMGLAVAYDREFKILASSRLDTTGVVRRIAGDRPVFRFDEGEMEGENGGENGGENRGQEGKFSRCVDSLLDFMDLNWRKGRHSSKKTSKKPSSESGAG